MSQLEIEDVAIAYQGPPVVSGVTLRIEKGEIGCLLGPSGCGKTSLLRAVAGFEPVMTGEIRLGGKVVAKPAMSLAPEQRRIGMVFQDFALFPHLTVAQNIGFGLNRMASAERTERIGALLRLTDLEGFHGFHPHELSGGQQQRVALARAMAPRPDLLLMDEAFSAIDAEFREQLASEVRAMLKADGTTAVLVTHDQSEAFATADRIGVLGRGRLRQWDSAYRLYHEPADRFVAEFIGEGAMIGGVVRAEDRVETELGVIHGEIGAGYRVGEQVSVLLRPDDIIHDDDSPQRLEIASRSFRGSQYLFTLRLESGAEIQSLAPSHHDHLLGETIGVRLDVKHLTIFR